MRMSDKGIRAGYKNSTYIASLYDASYYDCFQITGTKDDIQKLFNSIFPLMKSDNWNDKSIEHSYFMYEIDKYPQGFIGPIRFLVQNNINSSSNDISIIFFIHPSIFDQVTEEMQKIQNTQIQFLSKRGDYLRYQLTGPRSNVILQNILKLAKVESKIQRENNGVWNTLSKLRSCAELPSHCVLAINVKNPQLFFPPQPAKKIISKIQEITKEEKEKLLTLLTQTWKEKYSATQLWNFESDIFLQTQEISSNSNSNSSNIPILLVQRNGGDCEYIFPKDSIQQNNYDIGSGWDIIIPKHLGMKFWKSIVFAGARVIGMNSHISMELERGSLSFPLDYIDSNSYKTYKEKLMLEDKNKYEKKPPSKRVNYPKINSMFPWKLSWQQLIELWKNKFLNNQYYHNLLISPDKATDYFNSQMECDSSQYFIIRESNKQIGDWLYCDDISQIPFEFLSFGLVATRVSMNIRGTPKPGCFICFPTIDDLKIIHSDKKFNSDAFAVEDICDKISSKPDTNLDFSFNTKRDVIGFITSGGHRYSQGKGFGISCCSFLALYLLRVFFDRQ